MKLKKMIISGVICASMIGSFAVGQVSSKDYEVEAGTKYYNHFEKIIWSKKYDMYKVYVKDDYLYFDTIGEAQLFLNSLNKIGNIKDDKKLSSKYIQITFTNKKMIKVDTFDMTIKNIK